jgi:serine-type D-Ala-D-Ala carboxypeptidase (penicillin-binding protein 5/6)
MRFGGPAKSANSAIAASATVIAAVLVLAVASPAAGVTVTGRTSGASGAPTVQAAPTPVAPTPTGLPPAAPQPTSSANSPGAPDPHPPAGGIGPAGEAVGGAALLSRGLVVPPAAPALPTGVTAAAWVLVDLDSGQILAGQDPHGRYQPASILKILTVDTLLAKLPGSRAVTVSAAAAGTEGSRAGLVAGGSYTIDQLFSGLLLVSGNDTAMALAEAAGGVAQTVAAMNAKALSLGAYDTLAQTPSGLDGWQQLTSAYDMALFLRAAVNDKRFVAYDQQPTAVLPPQHVNGNGFGAVSLVNQGNPFLTEVPGGFFSKIGFTDAAQHTYVAATERDGRRLGVVFLRAQRWPLDQWQQAAKLFDWGYALPSATPAVGRLDAAYLAPKPAHPNTTAGAKTTAGAGSSGASGPGAAGAAESRFAPRRVAYAAGATLLVLAALCALSSALGDARQWLGRGRRTGRARPER